MSGSITRHNVMVRGRPTEVLCVGQSLQEAPQNLVLFIPGNPGLVSYYTDTMQTLYASLGGSHAVWTVSHAGHCLTQSSLWPGWQHVYDLEQQVQHKVAFLEDHLPRGTRVTLVGHCIGCHIILRLLKHFENKDDITISRSYFVFPAFERVKASPNGTRWWPVVRYLRWFVMLLVWSVGLLPGKLKDTILHWYFGEEVAPCCIAATRELLHVRVVQNMLWLGYHHLQVVELDLDTVRKHKDKILLYYGTSDDWCPQSYWEELRARVDGVEALLCEEGYQHAFVLRHANQMAEKLARWIKS